MGLELKHQLSQEEELVAGTFFLAPSGWSRRGLPQGQHLWGLLPVLCVEATVSFGGGWRVCLRVYVCVRVCVLLAQIRVSAAPRPGHSVTVRKLGELTSP